MAESEQAKKQPRRARFKVSAPAPDRTQLAPNDWVRQATELLISRSVDAIKIDTLSKELGVTRGSFYWHFEDRDDLLRHVLLSWQEQQTEHVIATYRHLGVAKDNLIRELAELPFHGRAAARGAAIELAIRAWARRDEMARKVVDLVDEKRLTYLRECFAGMGFSIAEAKARAFLLYCYMQSEPLFASQGTSTEKSNRRNFVSELLIRPLGAR